MKTPEQWIDKNSQSGPFDQIDSSEDATELIEAIQRDALSKIWEWFSLSNEGIRLRMGELSRQEIRNIRACLRAILGIEKLSPKTNQ